MMDRRGFMSAGVLAGIAAAVTGCGGRTGSDDPLGGGGGGGADAVTFAAAMFAESGRGPKLKALVDDFNESHPEVTVEPASVPFSSFGQTIFTQMGGGGGPDVIRFDHTDFYAAADAGLLVPFDDLVDTSGYQFPSPDKWNFYNDIRYGVAFEISNYCLIHNPKLVKDVPTTYDEFLTTAKEQTKDGVYGFAYRTTMPEQAGMWFDISNFVFGFGGAWSDDGGAPTFNDPKVLEGVEKFAEVYRAKVTPPGATAADYRRMFAEGKIAMMLDNGGVPPIVLGQNPDAELDAAKTPLPSGRSGQVVTPLGVNANSEDKTESVKAFLTWLLEDDTQAKVQEVLGASSPAIPQPRSESQREALPFVDVYDEATETGIPFVVNGMEVQTPELRQATVAAVVKVLQGQASVEKAMGEVQAEAEKLKK